MKYLIFVLVGMLLLLLSFSASALSLASDSSPVSSPSSPKIIFEISNFRRKQDGLDRLPRHRDGVIQLYPSQSVVAEQIGERIYFYKSAAEGLLQGIGSVAGYKPEELDKKLRKIVRRMRMEKSFIVAPQAVCSALLTASTNLVLYASPSLIFAWLGTTQMGPVGQYVFYGLSAMAAPAGLVGLVSGLEEGGVGGAESAKRKLHHHENVVAIQLFSASSMMSQSAGEIAHEHPVLIRNVHDDVDGVRLVRIRTHDDPAKIVARLEELLLVR